ncbi:Hisactophilin c49s mutant phototropin phy3 fusion [Pyrenophora seminiperda CCB06]|uniref:Hisactophilin c49s mutant phototropin phy3 fusion n=1 Tax=Pyrenophora seminiperda CCB06 TaxID=1302712 RepID=A0A3M7MCU4_9PLEO|nr:Hisactophilin c49s mutant phototropin phy3 fusion [Pyrenophora seminiperda CCB06]
MFKNRMRSAHGILSSKKSSDVSRSWYSTTDPSKKGSSSEGVPAYVDSVMAPDTDAQPKHNGSGGAFNEPLVLDFATMQNGPESNNKGAPLTPLTSSVDLERRGSWFSDDEYSAPAPQIDLVRRDIHIPSRTSSSTPHANQQRITLQRRLSEEPTSPIRSTMMDVQQSRTRSSSYVSNGGLSKPQSSHGASNGPTTMRSSADSVISYESMAPSIITQHLPPLQQKGGTLDDGDRLSPLLEDDPQSFDLVCAPMENHRQFSLEDRSEQLFSKQHLEAIFADTASLLRFTSFLSVARPKSVPTLIYYLDALKALRAISYANAVAEALEPIDGLDFTDTPARTTVNTVLEEKASRAFDILVRDDLPAFITHVFIQIVSVSIAKRVTGNLPPMLREASEGLAEVFCLTDPSRTDNPIIFASEEFHRTTQYGVGYAIGRNCRFLQGPKTSRSTVARFGKAAREGKDHSEVLLNYRRDGSPFMNLLMMAPLLDSRGNLRYYIGAQIDVSGLVKESTDLEAFRSMLDQEEGREEKPEQKDEFQALSEMFNNTELDTVRKFGGNMHREQIEEQDDASMHHKPRLLIQDQSTFDVNRAETPISKPDGRLSGPYKHYIIVRPAPSLRILFTSPSLRVPGILQSRFLDRIGGSNRVRDSLSDALADGSRGVTAKIRWLPHAVADLEDASEEGRPRWIHCTPLLGQSGAVGVWMVVLVDEKEHLHANRRFRQAPPIPNDIRANSLAQHSPRRQNGRPNEFDERDTYSSRGPSPFMNFNGNGSTNGNGSGRVSHLDTLRNPSSPRRAQSPLVYAQRGLTSAHSSINGPQASVDSFRI